MCTDRSTEKSIYDEKSQIEFEKPPADRESQKK